MKLHLPVFLRKSLLSCLSAFIVCTVGSGAAWAEAQNLSFEGGTLTWDTQSESFTDESDAAAAFTVGDNVSFTGESNVALGQDITAGIVAIEQGSSVTIDLDVFELNVDRIELSGLLDMGYSLHIGEGTTLAVQSASAVLDSNLVLGDKGGFEVGAAASLNYNTLTLQGNTSFTLTAAGDGKTYTLLSGVSGLLDAQGNAISLDDTNNAASLYFDASQPGTGFWANGTLQLNNGALQMVLHNETVKEAITITTRQDNPAAYQYCAGVRFENVSNTSSDSYAYGGAIHGGSSSTITLSNNGSVTFSGNSANSSLSSARGMACGGAIYGDTSSTITLSNNESVSFSGNTARSDSSSARGGAIYVGSDAAIMLRDNGSVEFIGNTAVSISTFTYGSGSAYGGAIYGQVAITLDSNGSVVFRGNTASSSYIDEHLSSWGGAIFVYGSLTLSNNGSVEFERNAASASGHASGGAIYGNQSNSSIAMNNNRSVSFIGNTAESAYTSVEGGAISGTEITLSNNGSVTFSGNSAFFFDSPEDVGSSAYGGAIDGNEITLSNNGSVIFSGNTAAGEDSSGGAIYSGTITLNNNGSVVFSGNTASGSGFVYGGAICAVSDLSIRNNDSVGFYQNAEVVNGDYRLRSINARRFGDVISLSVAEGKNITFRDSIYIDFSHSSDGTFNLNADYTYLDEEGVSVTVEQKGDIIFTGATTVDDLFTVKGNVAGTEEEIRLSRTTEVNTLTNLYGGRLRVEEGAIYQGQGITAMEGSGATVLVKDATLSHSGYDLTFNAGTTLELAGSNTITGNVQMLEGSWLAFDGTESKGMSWLTGTLSFTGGANVSLSGNTDWSGQNEILMYVDGSVSGWDENTLSIRNGAGSSTDLRLVNGDLLVLNYNAETFKPYFKGDITVTTPQTSANYRYYDSISFENIKEDGRAYGGAINGDESGTITLIYNGSVIFRGNAVCDEMSYASGGAIYADGKVTLNNNTKVEFSGNSAAISSYDEDDEYPGEPKGGAIYGDVELCDNESVSFCGNSARYLYPTNSKVSSDHDFEFELQFREGSVAAGGAIMGTVLVAGNENALFEQNEVTHSMVGSGGAIYGDCITFSNNTSLTITGNAATASYARGGAIYGEGNGFISFSNNGNVKFTGNRVSATQAYGGAIYAYGNLSIQNNDSVLFEQNAEITDGIYRLRSIVGGGNGDVISLSAAAGKSIEFRDSVYITSGSTVNLNADYTYLDEEGVSITVKQQGDIVFTGATTVDDLYDVKGNVAGTEEEIRLSRTTEVNALTNLYGGRLRVEDGAIYQGQGITAHGGSEATVLVKDATLSHSGYDLTFNTGTTLELAGSNTITGNVQMLEGSWLAFDGTESKGMSWLTGNLSFTGGANVSLSNNTDWSGQNEILMYVDGSVSGWDENTLSIRNGAGSSTDLRLVNGDLLVLNYNAETFKPYFKGDLTITTRQTDSVNYRYYNSLSFEKIKVDGDSASGGAIYGVYDSTIALSDNGSVTFSENTASSSGGAIMGRYITLNNNGSVEFNGNESEYGGAIYGWDINLCGNESLLFQGNKAIGDESDWAGYGGAIADESGRGSIILMGNKRIAFIENVAISAGGAIDASRYEYQSKKSWSNIEITRNGRVEFTGNRVDGDCFDARGGAVASKDFALCDNGDVFFVDNVLSTSSYHASGGAICGDGGSTITLSDNGSVTFSGNTASSDGDAYGGAIDGDTITLSNNGSVTFSGNTASSFDYSAGGAISTRVNLNIWNNESVEFYQNAEVVYGTYRLRSIYAGGNGGVISLSAAAGKSIEFRDSVYITSGSTVNLNEDYTYLDEEGVSVTVEQKGDIVFTGATTVDDLYAVKDNVVGTEEEIRLSRTTVVDTLTNLYGGRLRVEEGAIYQGRGITAMEGSGATVRVQNATLSHRGYDLTFNAGTTLELAGANSITGNVQMLEGSTLRFDFGADAVSSLTGSLSFEDATTLQVAGYGAGTHELLRLNGSTVSGWDALSFTDGAGESLDAADFAMAGDSLFYRNGEAMNLIWTNAAGDALWNNQSLNWAADEMPYAVSVLQNVIFAAGGNETITMVGNQVVESLTVQQGGQFVLNGNADGTTLAVREEVLQEGNTALTVRGNLEAAAINAQGSLEVTGDLAVSGQVIAASLTLSDATATHTIGGNVTLSGAATVAGTLEVEGSFASDTLQVKSLTAGGSITTGKLTGDSATLTALNGNVELTEEHESMNGNSNVITATGGDVLVKDNVKGDGNIFTATAVRDDAGNITSGGNYLSHVQNSNTWSALEGSNNQIQVDASIRLDEIAGSSNTLTAGTSISATKITGSNNRLTAGTELILNGAINGNGNVLDAGQRLITNKNAINGDSNRLTTDTWLRTGTINGQENVLTAGTSIDVDGNIGTNGTQASGNILTAGAHININGGNGTITGSRNELRAEAYIKTGAITGDSNELTAGSYINARDITGNSNSLIAGNGNLVAGAVNGTGNTLSAVNGSITAASIAGAGNVVTARSLTVTGGVEGATLTLTNGDASNSIGGNVTLSGAATVAGALEVEGDVAVSGQVTAASLQAGSLTAGSLTAGALTLTDATATNTVSGNAALSGAVNVAGALQVGGDFSLESGASVANHTIAVGGAVTMSGSALTSTVISGATGNISISNSRLTTSGVETTSGNATITGTLATTQTAKEYANESEKSGGIKSFTTSLAKVGAGSSVITSVKVMERDNAGTQDTTTPLRMVIKDAAGNVIATSTNTVTLSNTKEYREFEFAPTLLDPAASYTFAFVDATTGEVKSVSLQLEDQRNNGNVALGDVTALTDMYATAKLGALVQFGYLGSENQLLGATVTTGNGALNLSGTYVAAANGQATSLNSQGGTATISSSVIAGGTNVAAGVLVIDGSKVLGNVHLETKGQNDSYINVKGGSLINIDGGAAHDASVYVGSNLSIWNDNALAGNALNIANADVQVENITNLHGEITTNLTNVYALNEAGEISASYLGKVYASNKNGKRGVLSIAGSVIEMYGIQSSTYENWNLDGTAPGHYFDEVNVADSTVTVNHRGHIKALTLESDSMVSILGGAYLDAASIDSSSSLITGGASKLDEVNMVDGATLRVTNTGNGVTTLANLNPGSTGTVTVDVVNGTLQTPVVNERVALGLNGGTLLIKAVEAHGTALGASVAAVNPHVVLASVSNAGAAEVTQISTIRMDGLNRLGSDEAKNDGIASLTVKGAFDADKITINAYKLATDEGNTSGFIQIDGDLTGDDNVLNADAHILVKGVLSGSGNTLTAYNGNVTLNATSQSLNGSNNTISATGGNVNLTDDMIGSRNAITVVAVDGVGGSILSANKWASVVGDTNTLTADADILLESVGSQSETGNNNVLTAGDSITINGTGNGTGINGSGNTLTAGTSIASRNIKGDRNQLTADEITATIVDGTGNALTGTTVDITGELKGSANTIEGNVIHVGTVSGTAQEIISNGVDNAADIAIDIDTLSGMNAVIGVLNDGSLNIDSMTAQTGAGDTGSYITVLKGNVGIGTLNTTAENTISVGASYGITVGSGSASNQTWTADSLAATGADGLTLTDSTVTISGAVESTAELNLAGDTTLTATSVQAGTLRLDGADVMLSADSVVADEVVVDTPANNTAVFNELVADKVTVTSASSLPDNLSVGGGSVIGELVADKLEVREGTATLGSTAKQTEQELQSIALQKGADLVLQGQTSLFVTDSVAMTAGSEVQIQSGATLQNGAVALSAAPGTAAAQLNSKTGANLVEMQRDTQFSIHDMLLVNTSISAAEGNTITISGVEGSENLHLLGGADFSLTFANNKADVGMAVIENSSPVTGITFSAGSTLTLAMDPSNNDFRDYNLVINMAGFEYEGGILAATGGITDLNAAGIYLGGWLGEMLAAQGVAQEGVGNLESPEVPGDSIPTVSYTYSTDDNVGMIISIHGLSVPEPTTTTLSLLALAALAARRRRR